MFIEVYLQVLGVSTLKRCSKCGEYKPLDMFHRCSSAPDGKYQYCKECVRQRTRDNSIQKAEYDKKYRAANKELRSSANKAWHERNRERRNANARTWRRVNRKRSREITAEWRRANPDKNRLSLQRRRARERNLPDTFTSDDWQYALDAFSGHCAICGRPPGLWHTLAMDHWIPISSPSCPGTVAHNIIPLCHSTTDGQHGCNNTKNAKNPSKWVIEKFGKRKGRAILKRIEAFLDSRRPEV